MSEANRKEKIEISSSIHDRDLITNVYGRSPRFFQNLMYSGYGAYKSLFLRKTSFKKKLNKMRKNVKLEIESIEKFQIEKLRKLLMHAYKNVTFYKNLFKKINFNPDIENLEGIRTLPFLTKEMVSNNQDILRSRNYLDYSPFISNTGGSTGKPLAYLLDKEMNQYRVAEYRRQWLHHGYRFRDRVAIIRGRVLEKKSGNGVQKPWRWDLFQNFLYLSSYHLNEKMMNKYISLLEEWKPRFIAAYPFSAYTLANHLYRRGKVLQVDAVFTSSETLYPGLREKIEHAFQCKVIDNYGLGEPGLFYSGECCPGNMRISSDISYIEIIDKSGNVLKPGVSGEIVQTCFHNYSMPFIRYKTGDVGVIGSATCQCDSNFPVFKKIIGRTEDMIKTPEGDMIPPAPLTLSYEYILSIDRCQFVQEDIHNIKIKIVKKDSYKESDTKAYYRILRDILGPTINIDFEFVDHIPLTESGKYRFVVSNISKNS